MMMWMLLRRLLYDCVFDVSDNQWALMGKMNTEGIPVVSCLRSAADVADHLIAEFHSHQRSHRPSLDSGVR